MKQTAATCLGAGVMGLPAGEALAAGRRRWRVACRDVHLKATGKPDCWTAAQALGVDGLEVAVNEELVCTSLFHPDRKYGLATAAGVARLRADLRAHGLAVTAFCMSNRLDERLELEVAWMQKLVVAAKSLRVPAIRIDVVPRVVARDQFLPFAVRACQRLVEQVAGTSIRLGIENHGTTTNDPAFLEPLFKSVGSAQLGLTLDACNLYWFGHPLRDLYGICERFAGRVVHTHCKNIRYPEDQRNQRRAIGWEYERYACPVNEGDIDYRRVADILRRTHYRGDLCLENECLGHYPKEQHAGLLAQEVAFLRSVA